MSRGFVCSKQCMSSDLCFHPPLSDGKMSYNILCLYEVYG
jgi:hypothetical protein